METNELKMKKNEIIAKIQEFGQEVNPGRKKEELLQILADLQENAGAAPGVVASSVVPVAEIPEKAMSDTDKIMQAIGGLVKNVDDIAKRVNRLEVGGKDDFKMDMKTEDVAEAARTKSSLDPKIVKIVEDTLGIDFGIEIKGNSDRPGFELSILVPRRLSSVPTAFRPIRDEVTGNYRMGADKRIIEEEYWPGDKRSMQLGSTASYDVVQDRCNRIRAFILSWYQKNNKPQPEFKIK